MKNQDYENYETWNLKSVWIVNSAALDIVVGFLEYRDIPYFVGKHPVVGI